MHSFIDKLNRKKYVSFDTSPLPRVLTLFDLTTLGIGSTVGVGFYILAGQVARNTAGPAVTISFLIAAIASVFSGLCYAEFGARVPKTGSAYVYSYVCVGEFVAFTIGWNLILEYVIGVASVARGYSAYVDDLANNSISEAFKNSMPINSLALSPYPDFFAFGMILLVTIILLIGVKESTTVNNIFTGINSFVIAYVIVAGATQADVENWRLTEEDVNNASICSVLKDEDDESLSWGTGGFAPYGFDGIMKGAATCFFGFVGFDVIATTGEEALKPERNIPLAIALSLLFVFLAYFGMSCVLTLAVAYCMEDPNAPLIELFEVKGMMVSKWIVSVGAIFGFSASLVGAMFPMPRVIYAMADDGLLFRLFARVNKRLKTPVLATILSGLFAGIMALLFDLDDLVDMMSIGTLMAYTIVSLCVMLLRYQDRDSVTSLASEYTLLKYEPEGETDSVSLNRGVRSDSFGKAFHQFSWKDYVKQLPNTSRIKEPTELTSSLVNYAILSFCLFCFLLALFLSVFSEELASGDTGIIVLVVVTFLVTVINVVFIFLQPPSSKKLHFKVPFVPWLPAISVFINLYLMCNLSRTTWLRFVVWMAIGLAIYFIYGIRHSTGSDVPITLSRETGRPSIVPSIFIDPPTPWGSIKGPSTTTIKAQEPKRNSIIDNILVMNGSVVLTSKEIEENDMKPKTEGSNSQCWDLNTPQRLESISETSSDSEGEVDEQKKNKGQKARSRITTEATVYAVNDQKDYQQNAIIAQESINTQSSPPSPQQIDDSSQESTGTQSSTLSNQQTDSNSQSSRLTKETVALGNSSDSCDIDKGRDDAKGQNPASIFANELLSDHEKEVADLKDVSSEQLDVTIDSKKDALATDFPSKSTDEIQKAEEEATPSRPSLKATLSAPLESNASSFPPATLTATSASSSLPATPRSPRNAAKPLVRASSFDNIPPSAMDSPFAKRVKKFVIIPVKVPQPGEDPHDSRPLSIDGASQDGTPLSEAFLDGAPSLTSADLKSRLLQLQQHAKSPEKDGSTEISTTGKPSATDLLFTLDPIRERGESKVQQEDISLIHQHLGVPYSTNDRRRKSVGNVSNQSAVSEPIAE